MENKQDYLLPEERSILEESIKNRKKMIDELFKNGVPDVKTMRLANEILTGTDNAVLKMIELRQKNEQHQDDMEVITASILATKQAILEKQKNITITAKDKTIDLPDEYIPIDIVPGEGELHPTPLDVDDFIEEK